MRYWLVITLFTELKPVTELKLGFNLYVVINIVPDLPSTVAHPVREW